MADSRAIDGAEDSERIKRQKWLESLTPQQLEAVRAYSWDRILRARKVDVNGKQVSMKALAEDVQKRKEEYSSGMYDEDVRTIPRWQAQEAVPGHKLRPGSQKQQLRPEEEESLELRRMGHGNVFASQKSIFGLTLPWQRNFAFGIFARPARVKETLGPAWSGTDFSETLDNPAFYHDILQRCNQLELTLMLHISRPLKIQELKPAIENVLQRGMERLSGSQPLPEQQQTSLRNFMYQLDEGRLQNSGCVENGSIVEGTHIIIGADPKGGLRAEAITPGPISQRKTSFFAVGQNPLITAAMFDAFIGPNAADALGKRQTARSMLWAANGLPFEPYRGKGVIVGEVDVDGNMDVSSDGMQEQLMASTSLFHIKSSLKKRGGGGDGGGADDDDHVPMFLNRIARKSITASASSPATM